MVDEAILGSAWFCAKHCPRLGVEGIPAYEVVLLFPRLFCFYLPFSVMSEDKVVSQAQ